jgi:hypothetical protein
LITLSSLAGVGVAGFVLVINGVTNGIGSLGIAIGGVIAGAVALYLCLAGLSLPTPTSGRSR